MSCNSCFGSSAGSDSTGSGVVDEDIGGASIVLGVGGRGSLQPTMNTAVMPSKK